LTAVYSDPVKKALTFFWFICASAGDDEEGGRVIYDPDKSFIKCPRHYFLYAHMVSDRGILS
jgi:hypothetical protein